MIIRENSAGNNGGIRQGGSLISIDENFRSLEIVDSPLHARPHRAIVRTSGGGEYRFDICKRAYKALRKHFQQEIREEVRREERQRAERIVARRMNEARDEIIHS